MFVCPSHTAKAISASRAAVCAAWNVIVASSKMSSGVCVCFGDKREVNKRECDLYLLRELRLCGYQRLVGAGKGRGEGVGDVLCACVGMYVRLCVRMCVCVGYVCVLLFVCIRVCLCV